MFVVILGPFVPICVLVIWTIISVPMGNFSGMSLAENFWAFFFCSLLRFSRTIS